MGAVAGECRNQRDFGFYAEGCYPDQKPEDCYLDYDWNGRCEWDCIYYYEANQLCSECRDQVIYARWYGYDCDEDFFNRRDNSDEGCDCPGGVRNRADGHLD